MKQMITMVAGLLVSVMVFADPTVSAVNSSQCGILKKTQKPFILALKKGESVQSAILQCANDAELNAASLSGLGAFMPVTLRYFDHLEKQYRDKTIPEFMEVTNLSGNITFLNGKRVNHIHVTLSDGHFNPVAGHLKNATVSAVLEVLVTPLSHTVTKVHDEQVGLDVIQDS